MDKIFGAVNQATQQAQQESHANEQFPWYFRLLAKALGVIGGAVSVFAAVWLLLFAFWHFWALLAGILMIVSGVLIIIFEAPFLCVFLESINRFEQFSDSRPYWQKSVMYACMALVPFVMWFSFNTFLSALTIGGCAILYGIMAIGKKADHSRMMPPPGGSSDNTGTSGGGAFPSSGGPSSMPAGGPFASAPAYGNPWEADVKPPPYDNQPSAYPPAPSKFTPAPPPY